MDEKYKFEKINSVKAIIENREGKALLIQELPTDEWMPLHWGLPGGRPYLKESLFNTFKRISLEEIGLEIEPLGLYKIKELLHDDRTVLMFIVVVRLLNEVEIKGRINSFKWVGLSDVEKMKTEEFSAFYYKKLLLDYLSGNREFMDLKILETEQYYDLDQDEEYIKWIESGKKSE